MNADVVVTRDGQCRQRNVCTESLGLLSAACVLLGVLASSCAHAGSIQINLGSPPWHRNLGAVLGESQSDLAPIPGSFIVTGTEALAEAKREGRDVDSHLEAEIFSADDVAITFSYVKSGYVSTSDWASVDPSDLLLKLQEKYQNLARAPNAPAGLRVASIDRWLLAPNYDRQTQTVLLIVSGVQTDGRTFWNGVGLKLGRFGVELIELTGPLNSSVDPIARLYQAADAFSFDPGFGYEDYVEGSDKLAPFGIARLVKATLGLPQSQGVLAFLLAPGFAHWLVLIKFLVLLAVTLKGLRVFIRRANKPASQLYAEKMAAENALSDGAVAATARHTPTYATPAGSRPGDAQLIQDLEEDSDTDHTSSGRSWLPWWTAPLFRQNYYKVNAGILSKDDLRAFRLIYTCFSILFLVSVFISVGLTLWFRPVGRLRGSDQLWLMLESLVSFIVCLALGKRLAAWKNPSLIRAAEARAAARR